MSDIAEVETRIGSTEVAPADRYAALAENIIVNLSPTYVTVVDGRTGAVVRVPSEVGDMLLASDGTRTVAEIMHALESDTQIDDERAITSIVNFVDLQREGAVLTYDAPHPTVVRTAGDREIYYPTGLQVELTTACNLRCSYCYRQAGPAGEDRLATDELLRILGELIDSGLLSVELTGGEPTMHPDFPEILQFCGENLSLVAMLTNGTLITDETIALMQPYQKKMVFSVSLDSHRSEVHDARRGREGAFEATVAGIKRLVEAGFLTRIAMTVDEENWPDLEGTLLLSKELGATTFTFAPVLPLGRGASGFAHWTLDAKEVARQEKELKERHSDYLHLYLEDEVEKIQSPGGCGAGHRTYTMDPKGSIRPCATFDAGTAEFGSLRNRTPAEVFGGPLARAFAMLRPPRPETCQGCEQEIFCTNCVLRSELAREWLPEGACKWLDDPQNAEWRRLLKEHSATQG